RCATLFAVHEEHYLQKLARRKGSQPRRQRPSDETERTYSTAKCWPVRKRLEGRTPKSSLLRIVDSQFLPTADTETTPSIPWFAATQDIKCKQNLSSLAPKGCFISAEAV